MNMVDLAREERLKKYEKLLQEFDAVKQSRRIEKLSKHKDEVPRTTFIFPFCEHNLRSATWPMGF